MSNSTSGDWSGGEEIEHIVSISSNNPYKKDYDRLGVIYRVTGTYEEQGVAGFSSERVFEENAGITDISNYTERTTSNSSGPEHSIAYVAETVRSDLYEADYDKLTTCGLSLVRSQLHQC